MTVVDVNSGRSKEKEQEMYHSDEQRICKEIAKQLRLRDIGGIIVVDIYRYPTRPSKRIYYEMKRELAKDKAKTVV